MWISCGSRAATEGSWGHQNQARPGALAGIGQHTHDLRAGASIQSTRRFIGKDDFGIWLGDRARAQSQRAAPDHRRVGRAGMDLHPPTPVFTRICCARAMASLRATPASIRGIAIFSWQGSSGSSCASWNTKPKCLRRSSEIAPSLSCVISVPSRVILPVVGRQHSR